MNEKIIEEYAAILKKRVGFALSIDECKHFVDNVMHSIIWHGPDEVPPILNTVVEDGEGTRWVCDAVYRWWVEKDGERILMGKNKGPNRWRYPAPEKKQLT